MPEDETLFSGWELRRCPKRRRLRIRILPGGEVVADAPSRMPLADVEAFVRQQRGWIEKHLKQQQELRTARGLPEPWSLRDGGFVLFRGRPARIRCSPGVEGSFEEADQTIVVLPLPPGSQEDAVAPALGAFLRREAERVFSVRMAVVGLRAPRRPSRWRLSEARSQWGSCSSSGEIRLSWRLIFFPDECIDYVIAHELSHLVEMNHSPAFWRVVETLDPLWRARRRSLREGARAGLPL